MKGRTVPLSRPRRLVGDLLHFAAGVPSVPVQRRMDLGPVAVARRASPDRPAWTAIFAKGFALVAAEVPALRRAYCKFPWPHLYEVPASVATIMVEREYEGEPAVLGLRVKDPAGRSVADVSARVRGALAAPVESVPCFRRALRLAGWPRPVRRAAWWVGLNVGRWRANHFGTFGVSVYAALGAESLHPLSPLTATLNYGPIADDGAVDVRLTYDHRVLDGATVARALARLERVLNTTVCAELIRPPATRVAVAA
ncbi:MAG: 2-oxo acid dehydrogenase subunit E2 [Gemmataceae bacterium]|nr:2-oxo acid dehydrogenase subunit E2 [Gemmataceae bacterium]